MTRRHQLTAATVVAFLACILAANYATTTYGLIPVGFGLVATAGTYFAGLTFVLRDALSDLAGRRAVALTITAGALLSFAVAAPFIAAASAVAFALAELGDWAVYEPLRKRGYIRAAVASNLVGTVIDTVVFLGIAGFPIWQALPGQILAKLTVTAVVVAGVTAARALSRQPLRVSGSGSDA